LKPKQSQISRVAGILTLGWSNTPGGRSLLRRTVVRLARGALRIRSQNLPGDMPRAVLVVSPHPDDEALGCGGLVSAYIRKGVSVHVVFITDGSASHPAHPKFSPGDIAAIRKAEAREATGILGVARDNLFFMDAADGEISRLDPTSRGKLVSRIAALLEQLVPNVIALPCRRDGSTDHEAVFELVGLALAEARQSPRILEFPIWAWRNPLLLMKPLLTSPVVRRLDIRGELAAKVKAIDAYASQVRPLPPEREPLLSAAFTSEFVQANEYFFES
jgi:LmbE family N-acetylglucosaminyl deacetylase